MYAFLFGFSVEKQVDIVTVELSCQTFFFYKSHIKSWKQELFSVTLLKFALDRPLPAIVFFWGKVVGDKANSSSIFPEVDKLSLFFFTKITICSFYNFTSLVLLWPSLKVELCLTICNNTSKFNWFRTFWYFLPGHFCSITFTKSFLTK